MEGRFFAGGNKNVMRAPVKRATRSRRKLRRAKRQKAITIRPEYGRVRSGCERS